MGDLGSAQLLAGHGPLQLSLFDERNLIKLRSESFPGERLVVCRNPLLASERARKRHELLTATEEQLGKIAVATQRTRRPLRGQQAIALRVGRIIERFHMAKHFELTITDTSFGWRRREEAIAAEPPLMDCMSSAPASATRTWTHQKWCPPTRAWHI